MAQIQSGENYSTGDQVTAANLNNHVNGAILIPGAIKDQVEKSVPSIFEGQDYLLVYDSMANQLNKSSIYSIISQPFPVLTTELLTSPTTVGSEDLTIKPSDNGDLFLAVNPLLNEREIRIENASPDGNIVISSQYINIEGVSTSNNHQFSYLYPNQIGSSYPLTGFKLPYGTTVQRPTTGWLTDEQAGTDDNNIKLQGVIRYNTETKNVEYRTQDIPSVEGGPWKVIATQEYVQDELEAAGPRIKAMVVFDGDTRTVRRSYKVKSVTGSPAGGDAHRITFDDDVVFEDTFYAVLQDCGTQPSGNQTVGASSIARGLTYVDVRATIKQYSSSGHSIPGGRWSVVVYDV